MTNGGSNLPRADVSNGALAGALVALILAIIHGGEIDLALYGPAITVVLQFLISYLVPQYKVAANGVAGAIVTIVVAIIDISQGAPIDEGALETAVTALVTFFLTLVIPPRQP